MKIIKKILISILTWESRAILSKYRPFIVAVTGSVGKTSTKDAIFCVLKAKGGYVRKSEKSLNSEIGLPLTIIGVPNAWHSMSGWLHNVREGLKLVLMRKEYPDILVLEVGADHPGDIQRVAKWLHPDIVVLTKISRTPVHVEFFHSPEQVFEEKASLAWGTKKGGTLVSFADDEKIAGLAHELRQEGIEIISYGMNESAAVRGYSSDTMYEGEDRKPVGISFMLKMDGVENKISLSGILGNAYMYPLLAAAGVGKAIRIDNDKIAQALMEYDPPKGRMNILEGLNGSTLIDDTYNSSPDAVLSALEALDKVACSGSKIAILGDMMELGKYSAEEHRKVVKQAKDIASQVILVGPRFRSAAESVSNDVTRSVVFMAKDAVEAGEHAKSVIKSGDVVLIKGSQAVRMERTAASLLNDPSRAGELLVRQEKEWLLKK